MVVVGCEGRDLAGVSEWPRLREGSIWLRTSCLRCLTSSGGWSEGEWKAKEAKRGLDEELGVLRWRRFQSYRLDGYIKSDSKRALLYTASVSI